MRVGSLSREQLSDLLLNKGLRVSTGPFNMQINTSSPVLLEQLISLYKDYKLANSSDITEFHVKICPARSIRKPFSSFVRFSIDGQYPFALSPEEQALAVLEWGVNLAIAVRTSYYLLFHSAVVERNGHVILFPAWPGSGKTTLCTVLSHRGFRLFSDEFGLMNPNNDHFSPLPRLMPLKNQSIQVIKDYLPEAALGKDIPNTKKGTVAHVRPPLDSIVRSQETAKAKWIVFPKWVAGSALKLEPLADSEAFLLLASNSFNYEVLGQVGFEAVTRLIDGCQCYKLVYSDFDEAITALRDLTNHV